VVDLVTPARRLEKIRALRNRHIFQARDIALLLDTPQDRWTTRRARRWLLSSGAGEWRGGRVVTNRQRLRAHFPEVLDRILVLEAHDDDDADD
jgi:hypothetical protein